MTTRRSRPTPKSSLLCPFIALVLLVAAPPIAAQDSEPFLSLGEQRELYSDVLGESRDIIVGLPASYEGDEDETYPVVYLLDGPGHFHHTTGTARFLARVGRMPEVIVVAIPNTDRTRDLTPPILGHVEGDAGTAGGADAFLDFIESELKPYININYRARDYSILIGHSLGGLFANHALVHRPEVFNAYVSISPSLWWDEQRLVEQANAAFDHMDDLVGDLYMTMGNEGGAMLGGALKFAGVLEEKAPESLRWEFEVMEEEDHGSVPHRSTYYGLERIFDGWNLHDPVALYLTGGLEAIDRHFEDASERFGYERKPTPRALSQIGARALEDEDAQGAAGAFTRIVEQDRNSIGGHIGLARAHELMGHRSVAVEHYQDVLGINPSHEGARSQLAEWGVDLSDFPEAIEVPVDVLQTYVGRYWADDEAVEFVLDGRQLRVVVDGDPYDLEATSQTRFRVVAVPAFVTFNVDATGAVPSVTLEQGGEAIEATRMN